MKKYLHLRIQIPKYKNIEIMIREMVKIDRDLCNGCGECIPNCHEGALQMIDGKATLVSELMCDGLGACLGHCPVGAITIEKREALPYDEVMVIKEILPNGKNVLIAHLSHLKEHGETAFLKQGVTYLRSIQDTLNFDLSEVIEKVHNLKPKSQEQKPTHMEPNKPDFSKMQQMQQPSGGGCPGSRTVEFAAPVAAQTQAAGDTSSQLRQWPVQMHLVNPGAGYFQNSDLLLAADCVAFSMGNFHSEFLKGKSLAIACPKLDSNMEVYISKLVRLIDESKINTLTVAVMEVPCCGGLVRMAQQAVSMAHRKVPVKQVVVSIQGEVISENWM